MAEKVRKIERAVLVILGVGMTVIMFINACGRYWGVHYFGQKRQ